MAIDEAFKKELADAEAALKRAEEAEVPDDMKTACCLENVAELLKSKKMRLLDANTMMARARVMRIDHHKNESQKEGKNAKEIRLAVRGVARRKYNQNLQNTIMVIAIVAVGSIVGLGILLKTSGWAESNAGQMGKTLINGVKDIRKGMPF